MKVDAWLKMHEKDGINFDLLKTQLTVPNPLYLTRVRMGFKTKEYSVYGKCYDCNKEIHKTYQVHKDIPKTCIFCGSDMKYVINEVDMRKFDALYKEVGNELWIPRALVHRYASGNFTDNTTLGDREVDFKSLIQLGPNEFSEYNQTQFVEQFTEALKKQYGAIGQAHPGYGKTLMALEVIARLKRPAIILVHKEFFMSQWADRISTYYDISPDEIGFIQQDSFDFRGKKIAIAMVQSLLAREYPKSLFDYFGTICVDEVHRFAALEFRKAIVMFPARYRLGITATPKRADNLENVFFWHIGEIAVRGESQKLKPKIKVVKTNIEPTQMELRNFYDFRGKQNLNKVISYLITDGRRNRLIVALLKKALKSGRKIMVLSGRLDHLEVLKKMTDMEMVKDGIRYTTGYYIGGMTEEERTISATRDLIFATFQMAQEGLDIPDMDTLFLVTPRTDIEQAVGRILRVVAEKKEPTVVDFSDSIEICVNMLRKRVVAYRKLGYMY